MLQYSDMLLFFEASLGCGRREVASVMRIMYFYGVLGFPELLEPPCQVNASGSGRLSAPAARIFQLAVLVVE